MNSPLVPRVKVLIDPITLDEETGEPDPRNIHIYPEGDGARWLLKELKKAGGRRPLTRWPDGVWFTYSEAIIAVVENLAARCMRVKAVLIFKRGVDAETNDPEQDPE